MCWELRRNFFARFLRYPNNQPPSPSNPRHFERREAGKTRRRLGEGGPSPHRVNCDKVPTYSRHTSVTKTEEAVLNPQVHALLKSVV